MGGPNVLGARGGRGAPCPGLGRAVVRALVRAPRAAQGQSGCAPAGVLRRGRPGVPRAPPPRASAHRRAPAGRPGRRPARCERRRRRQAPHALLRGTNKERAALPVTHFPSTPYSPPSPLHLHPSVRCRRCAPARWERRSLRAPDGLRIPVSNLRDLAQHQDKSGVGNGLTHLVKAHCPGVYHGEHLDKSGAEVRAIRTGDWGSWPLSPAALAYAALDVLMRWTC